MELALSRLRGDNFDRRWECGVLSRRRPREFGGFNGEAVAGWLPLARRGEERRGRSQSLCGTEESELISEADEDRR